MKNVLVTGSEGYIGAVLIPKLLKQGYRVVGVDTCFYGRFNKENRQFRLVKADIRNLEKVNLDKIDAIIHLAALSNDPIGALNPLLTKDINFKATIVLAKKAKEQGVKRFIFSSSCSIYGKGKEDVVNENSPVNPLTAYAQSKISVENQLKKLADDSFCVGLMRNSTVYGYSPSFRNDLVVNDFTTCGFATKEIKVLSDGTPWRPLIDVRDLSDIFINFLQVDAELINGEIFNIGFNENNFQVRDLLDIVEKQISGCKIIYTHKHDSDSRSYKVNFDKLHSVIQEITMNWDMEKSVRDLIKNLTKINYSKKDYIEGSYKRINNIKKLLGERKLNKKLFWYRNV